MLGLKLILVSKRDHMSDNFEGLVQHCSDSSALAMELL